MIDGGHLTFSHHALSAEDLEGWCRGITKDAIAASLGAAEQKITDAVSGGKGIHPPLGEPVTHGTRGADCPVCGGATLGNGEDLGCARCDARMHGECYWGRVATLAEWQMFVQHVNGGPDEYEGPPPVCAQCRAKDDPA